MEYKNQPHNTSFSLLLGKKVKINTQKMNENDNFKWDRKVESLLKNVFEKSKQVKGKSYCLLSKQYQNIESIRHAHH